MDDQLELARTEIGDSDLDVAQKLVLGQLLDAVQTFMDEADPELLESGTGEGGGFGDEPQFALHLCKRTLDQHHCSDFCAVGKKLVDLGVGKELAVNRTVGQGCGHWGDLVVCL